MKPQKVVIADDHPILRRGLLSFIEGIKGFKLVGEAENGQSLLELIANVKPDIAIVDYFMPNKNVVDVCKALSQKKHCPNIIVLTNYSEPRFFEEVYPFGIQGYLTKNHLELEVVSCLTTVAAGGHYFTKPYDAIALKMAKSEASYFLTDQNKPVHLLSETERTILYMIGQRKTSGQIAEALCSSPYTIKNHRHNICRKLGLKGGNNSLLSFALYHKKILVVSENF